MMIRLTLLFCSMLFFCGCQSTVLTVSETMPDNIEGVTVKVISRDNANDFKLIGYYRSEDKILEKVEPLKPGMNTVYRLYLNNKSIFTVKVGPMGTEFRSSDNTRKFNPTKYTVKMAGDKEGKIRRMTIYTDDFTRTLDGFWFRDSQVIPWSDKGLINWKIRRGEEL